MRVSMEDKMKILIAGDGKVGASLTRELTAAGYDITLIDSKQNVLDICAVIVSESGEAGCD